mmetsp:Transcript_27477/g.34002  ORF Transcript_27477/g.34002 Transcript_27477/m.34002 type:complete len:222 (-) Transcript_27477:174-839(-)
MHHHFFFVMQVARFAIKAPQSPFHLIINQGSITNFQHPRGAIVNAANEGCLGGGGVDGAISAAGGEHLHEDRLALPVLKAVDSNTQNLYIRCPVGDAKITGPRKYDKLKVPYVIHAVGPNYWGYNNSTDEADELLVSAYEQSLNRAREVKLEAVAFSLLSAGVFKGARSLAEVLGIAVHTICDNHGYEELKEVHLFAFTQKEVDTLLEIAQNIGLKRERKK